MIDESNVVCPNGHSRKFLVTHTSVGYKVVRDIAGKLVSMPLDGGGYGTILIYHCADCGSQVVKELNKDGSEVSD
jgi:hypothetical protein